MSRQASKRSSKGEVARKTSALCDQFLKALKGCCWRCCCRKKNGKERKRCALSECAVTEMCIYIYIYFLVLLQKGPKKMIKKSASIASKNLIYFPVTFQSHPSKHKARPFSGSKTDTPKRVDVLSTSTKNSHLKTSSFFPYTSPPKDLFFC